MSEQLIKNNKRQKQIYKNELMKIKLEKGIVEDKIKDLNKSKAFYKIEYDKLHQRMKKLIHIIDGID